MICEGSAVMGEVAEERGHLRKPEVGDDLSSSGERRRRTSDINNRWKNKPGSLRQM